MKAFFISLASLLSCTVALGQNPVPARAPEDLLAANSVFYFRFDGLKDHGKAFQKTVLAKLLKEEFGDFTRQVGALIQNQLDQVGKDALKGEEKNDKALALAQAYKNAGRIFEHLCQHGVAAGVELIGSERCQVTLVFPDLAGKSHWQTVQPLLKAIMAEDGNPVKVLKLKGRTVYQVKNTGFAWWQEGNHLVCVWGTGAAGRTLGLLEQPGASLTTSALFEKLTKFESYETCSRGFVDAKQALDFFAKYSQNSGTNSLAETLFTQMVASQLGLSGIHDLTFHLGFEGKYQRSTVTLNVVEPEERKGLLKLIAAPESFSVKELPPLPSDAAVVRVHHVDWLRVFDTFNQLYRSYQMLSRIEEGGLPFGGWHDLNKQIQPVIDLDLRQDLLTALDPTAVLYQAYSEGPLLLGGSVALKVKDAAKLHKALDHLGKRVKNLYPEPDRLQIKTTTYHGAALTSFHVTGIPAVPTYTLHKGWLVLSLFPQSVKAYVWRSQTPAAAWKAPAVVQQAIHDGLKKGNPHSKLAALTVSDPRHELELLMPLVPIVFQIINADVGSSLDANLIPHTKAITARLSPNVTAFFEDGNAWRWETYNTVSVPSLAEYYVLPSVLQGASELLTNRGPFQVWKGGLTLPAPKYLDHPPQYAPKSAAASVAPSGKN